MSTDDQDTAENMDDDLIGAGDAIGSDEVAIDFPPDRPLGLPFADADVTDESLADRVAREQPEVSEADIAPAELALGDDDVDVTELDVALQLDMDDLPDEMTDELSDELSNELVEELSDELADELVDESSDTTL